MDPKSVLIIEDDKDLQDSLRVALEDAGFSVSAVADGEEGLRTALENKPALTILDLLTHSIHGNLFLERLRGDERGKGLNVIVLTNIDNDSNRERALNFGALEYLVKSKTPLHEVVAAAQRVLSA